MLHYILQVVAFQLGFLIIYDVFLRKETFFNWNRAYLLVTAVFSIVIPFVKINRIKAIMPEDFVIHLPQVILGEVSETNPLPLEVTNLAGIPVQPEPVSIWSIILFSGMCIALLILVFKLLKLMVLYHKHPKRWHKDLLIIRLINSASAFSFFHYVFIGSHIHPKNQSSILEHERIHAIQKHTLDLLIFELFRIVFWFNPLVYIYQSRISELHEFIADAKAIKHENKAEYYNNLLAQVFETQQFSFVNPFFKQSLIKKRILMLSKTKSKQIHILKYALLLPIVFTMLMYTSSYAQEKLEKTNKIVQTEDNLGHEELLKKYHNQIVQMKDNGATFAEINDFAMPNRDVYISSKTDYYKFTAYTQYIMGVSKKGKLEDKNEDNKELSESFKSKMNRTYEDYVAWKQTDEAKEAWENNTRDGVLRLIVNDFSNWTEGEKEKMDHKLEMIEQNDYFNKLLVVSMEGHSKMILQSPNPPATIVEINNMVDQDPHEDIEVPFAIVDQVPVMLSCQSLKTNIERKDCMSENIASHVSKNFNTSMAEPLGLAGKQRISVIFKINTNGDIVDVKARAPHPDLEEEAIRVIELLPKFQPGIHKGKAVTVPYSLPILFNLGYEAEPEETDEEMVELVEVETIETFQDEPLTEVPYAVVELAPIFQKCKDIATKQDQKKCTSNEVAMFVNKKFNLDLATQLGLEGRTRIMVAFKIGKDGHVFDVKARAPHPKLEEEAVRVIKLLPQFIPGKHRGELINVPYSLPILFQVAPSKKGNKKN